MELFSFLDFIENHLIFRTPKGTNRPANNGMALITSAPLQGIYGVFIDGNCVEGGWRIDSICILVNVLYPCVCIFVRWEEEVGLQREQEPHLGSGE